jgi:signal transduction histidine kinase
LYDATGDQNFLNVKKKIDLMKFFDIIIKLKNIITLKILFFIKIYIFLLMYLLFVLANIKFLTGFIVSIKKYIFYDC